MKLKDIIISEANGEFVAVEMGGSFNGMIKLNDTAAFIAENMQEDTTVEAVVQKLMAEYEVDQDTATKSVEEVAKKFRQAGLLLE